MWRNNYKLVVTEDKSQYFLKVFSNGNFLYFLLDSGADKSLVRECLLEGCSFISSEDRFKLTGIGGEREVPSLYLSFDLSEKRSAREEHRFKFCFGSIPEGFHPLLSGSIAGLLGTDFLSSCIVDFKNGLIKFF